MYNTYENIFIVDHNWLTNLLKNATDGLRSLTLKLGWMSLVRMLFLLKSKDKFILIHFKGTVNMAFGCKFVQRKDVTGKYFDYS